MGTEQGDPQRDANTADEAQHPHHENIIEEVAEELESRFLAAAEVATATSSPEVNLVDAVVAGLEGQPEPKDADPQAVEGKPDPQRASSTAPEDPDPKPSAKPQP